MNAIVKAGFLLILIILVNCKDENEYPDLPDNGVEENIGGKVLSSGQGLSGVVVTDGYNFTETNTEGEYSLPYSSTVSHIYISSPSGYSVSVENSVPKFYLKLNDATDKQKLDFDLQKLNGSDDKHYFVGIGDPQVRNELELLKLKPILDQLKNYISEQNLEPVHLMVAGDIVFDTPNMHQQSKTYFSAVNQPVYYAIGNHDHLKNTSQSASELYDKLADQTYIDHYGPTYYSFNRGKVHYVILDNILYEGGPNTIYSKNFTQSQLEWLKKDLSYISKDHALVVMFHAPTKSPFVDEVGNSAELWALLEEYADVQMISGHTHYHAIMEHQSDMVEHNIGAICGGWWEGPVCLCGTPLGYKIFEANGNNITWKYISYENPESQFTVFKPEERDPRLRSEEELLVNVWDWDSKWSVTWSEDNGGTYKDMIRISPFTYDPTAVQYFGIKGDNTVPMRSWIYAKTTPHIFRCIPGNGTNTVTIKVTNRFGEEFTQQVVL